MYFLFIYEAMGQKFKKGFIFDFHGQFIHMRKVEQILEVFFVMISNRKISPL